MNKKVIALLAVLVVGAAAAAVWYGTQQNNTPALTSGTTQQSTPAEEPDTTTDKQTVIVFTDDGFENQEYTTKAGQAVEVKNNSSMQLQFSSDDHPTHTEQNELNLAVLAPGESASFTPTQAGEWGFHDHINAQFTGLLRVE